MPGCKLVGLVGANPKGHVAEGCGPECRLALAPGPSWAQSPRPGPGPRPRRMLFSRCPAALRCADLQEAGSGERGGSSLCSEWRT